jgi:two-component system NtrC family sensor kinase
MQSRALTILLIRLAMAASLLVPLLLFAFASWNSYRNIWSLTDERLVRSLDVQREQATKAFEIIDLTLNNAMEFIAGMSSEDIRRQEPRLYSQFKKFSDTIPVVQSLWVYDQDGYAAVSSRAHPPPTQSFADRDFYSAHVKEDIGTYYGKVYNSTFNGQPFFTVSRRITHDDAFAGVLELSVLPSNFFRFYSTLAYTEGLQYGLIREDGVFLARYPAAPTGATNSLDENSNFRRTVIANNSGGFYTSLSPIDGIERRFAVQRFGNTSLFLTAGISSTAISNEWIAGMAPHLIFGVPATLIMFLTLFTVLRRTTNLYQEIDRRAAAEDALRQSQKLEAIGHLTGGVAHDFNNLLTIIIGNLETAQRQLESWTDGAQVKLARRLENAMHGAQRAASLTRRLLAFSRQQPLNPTAIDVNRLLNGVSDFLRRGIGEDVSLEIVGGAGVWPVEADGPELESVILNLAINARDAMPNGGKLTVEASNSYLDDAYCSQHSEVDPGQYVQIAVTDTGSGMSKDVVDRAFEPFFTTKATGHGTGLGLSQVYGFVKQSGGHVKIYSEMGEGTTIKLYLPRFMGNVPVIETTKKSERARGLTGECLLVVEDDPDVRTYVADTLGSLGYDVLQAESGEQALGLINEYNGIRLLLTDVVMPGMNGRKLAEAAVQCRPEMKILFMTGYSRNAIVHQGRLDPGVNLIQKPVTSEHLAAAVRKLLDA